jgi:adenosylhomocysteine nucleosidase
MRRVAIIAAMPGELHPLVRGWRQERRAGVAIWRHVSGDNEWLAACAGAGQKAATRAVAALEQIGPLHAAFSMGWVGALDAKYAPGAAYEVAGVIDAQTGERFSSAASNARAENPWLVTSSTVADAAEKQRLAASYGAGLVDMEAAAVARLALMRGIPFHAVKGVSDGVNDTLPDFNRFISPNGVFHTGRLILFVLPRPWLWPALIRMGENSKCASLRMAELLQNLLCA